jgi:hypothetical protein
VSSEAEGAGNEASTAACCSQAAPATDAAAAAAAAAAFTGLLQQLQRLRRLALLDDERKTVLWEQEQAQLQHANEQQQARHCYALHICSVVFAAERVVGSQLTCLALGNCDWLSEQLTPQLIGQWEQLRLVLQRMPQLSLLQLHGSLGFRN